MNNPTNISLKSMREHCNNCASDKCIKCGYAEMLEVERSSSHVRCGCEKSKNFHTWSFWNGYTQLPPEECTEFVQVTDDFRKRMVNLAWEKACDRKMESLEWNLRDPRPVYIDWCQPHFGRPFPDIK